MENLTKHKDRILNILFYCIIFITISAGIFIRTKYYLSGIPFWLDEIMLGHNFADLSFTDLFKPLDAYQKTPPLLIFGVLVCRRLFGLNELSLRLIPYLSGILALIMFYFYINRHIVSKFGIFIGTFFFSFCMPLIYLSAELKQYEGDVLFAVLFMILYQHINITKMSIKTIFFYSISSILLVLSSFPSLFMIPAIILSKYIKEKKVDVRITWVILSVIFAGFVLFFTDLENYYYLKEYWGAERGFGIGNLLLFIPHACKYFIYNFNTDFTVCIVIFIISGLYICFKENKDFFLFFISTYILASMAALAYIYPLRPKLCIFMLPMFIFIIAKNFDGFYLIKNSRINKIINFVVFIVLMLVYGIKIPYLNVNEDNLAYYNKSSFGRIKSIEDRNALKEYTKILLEQAGKNDKILASNEFLFSTRMYGENNKNHAITTYNLNDSYDYEQAISKFLKNNSSSSGDVWFAGRSDDGYFYSADIRDVIYALEKNKYKYEDYTCNNLYLIHIIK